MSTSPSAPSPGRPSRLRVALVFPVLAVLFVVLFAAELALGTVSIPLAEIVTILLGGESSQEIWRVIVLELRLPRAITACLAGTALALGGLTLQTLFRNPLAGPWALGITAGAQLGVAMVAVAGAVAGSIGLAVALSRLGVLADLSLAAGAFAGATAMLMAVVALSRRVNAVTLLIAGLMFGFLAQGLVAVLLHFTTENQVEVYENWNDGSFGGVTPDKLVVLAPAVALGLFLIGASIKPLNALLLGERYARSLGVRIRRTRNTALFAVVCLAGSVTAYCGPILFLDLAVPHLCRGLFRTTDHRILVPAVALVGSTVALAADLIVHLPWRQHFLHLNAVNALIGAPVVLWVLLRRRSANG